MEAARQRDTKAELEVRSLLHRAGLRFRVNTAPVKGLRRRGDIVFRRQRVVVFVDGCFWHGCPSHGTWPKANAEFWRQKIKTNQERDRDTDRRLRAAGWRVLRAWEHEDPILVSKRVEHLLRVDTCKRESVA